ERMLVTHVTRICQKRILTESTRVARAGDCTGFLLHGRKPRPAYFPARSERESRNGESGNPAPAWPSSKGRKPTDHIHSLQTVGCRERRALFRDCYLQ